MDDRSDKACPQILLSTIPDYRKFDIVMRLDYPLGDLFNASSKESRNKRWWLLEMKRSSQESHDRVLLELAIHGGWMVSSTLRWRLGMTQADLNPILEDLEKL